MRLNVLIFLLIFVIAGCAIQNKTNKKSKYKNVAFLYNPSETHVNAKYKIFHISDTNSILKIQLTPKNLLINSDGKKKKAKVLIKYKVYYNNDKLELYDSLSTIYNIDFTEKKIVNIDIPLKLKKNKYFIILKINDIFRNVKTENYFSTDKTSKFTKDNFFAISKKTNTFKFDNIVKPDDSLQFTYKRQNVDSFFVYYFKNTY